MTLSQTVTTAASLLENNMKHKSERMIKGRMRGFIFNLSYPSYSFKQYTDFLNATLFLTNTNKRWQGRRSAFGMRMIQ